MRTRISANTVAGEFVRRVEAVSGQNLLACNQCGKCSAGCPVVEAPDMLPGMVMRLAQLGIEDVLQAPALWTCASCLTCQCRCPKDVDLPRVMEALRSIALERGIQPVNLAAIPADLVDELPQLAIIGGFRKYSA